MKHCKKCGAEIAKNAKLCPKCGARFGLPGLVKVLIIFFIIFFCIIGCMASCTKGVGDAIDEAVKDIENEYKDINANTSFKVNESFENKHFKITVTSVNTNWTGYNQYTKPSDGKNIVQINLSAENVGNDSSDISFLYFKCYADGVVVDNYIWTEDNSDFGGTISSGKKTIGALYYEVPKNVSSIILEYSPNVLDDKYQVEFVIK